MTRTHRATLTFISNMLRQGAQLCVGLLATPIIIRGLGANLYGAYQMLEQCAQLLTRSDLRPMGTLRVMLAVKQHEHDYDEKQRLIGAAFKISLFMCLFIIIAGIGIVYYIPNLIKVDSHYSLSVQIAMTIIVFRIVLHKLMETPGAVLSGMNLDYKAMGLQAFVILFIGVAGVISVQMGWGIVGLATVGSVGVLISGVVNYIIAKKTLYWFKMSRASRSELVMFTKKTFWFLMTGIADGLLTTCDLLIIGKVLSPSDVAIFATTGAVLRFSSPPITTLLSSTSSGMADLCGRKAWERIKEIRMEANIIISAMLGIVGTGIILLNKMFLLLWIGEGYYAGGLINFLMVIAIFFRVLCKVDSNIIEAQVLFKEQSIITITCGAFVCIVGISLTSMYGSAGMLIASISGFIALLYFQRRLIRKKTPLSYSFRYTRDLRLYFVIGLLFITSYYLSEYITANTYMAFTLILAVNVVLSSLIIFYLGLDNIHKTLVTKRVKTLIAKK